MSQENVEIVRTRLRRCVARAGDAVPSTLYDPEIELVRPRPSSPTWPATGHRTRWARRISDVAARSGTSYRVEAEEFIDAAASRSSCLSRRRAPGESSGIEVDEPSFRSGPLRDGQGRADRSASETADEALEAAGLSE